MKTGGMEVLCDACGRAIKPMTPTAIFATFRGPIVKHKKADFCNWKCLWVWADEQTEEGP